MTWTQEEIAEDEENDERIAERRDELSAMSPKEISDILSATGIGEAVDLLFSMERKKVADILSVMTSDGRAKMWTSFSNRYDSIPIDTDRYLFVPRNISTTTQGLVDTKHKRSKTNSTASPSVASCVQGMGASPVLNWSVPTHKDLPTGGQCVMNSVNKSLELQDINGRLDLELLEVTQGKLIAKNPHARQEAYGCSTVGSRSFTTTVVAGALRKLLPGHNITLRNLCKKGKSKQAIESVASGGKGHFLVDGELDKVWYPNEDPGGDWRHMVLVEGGWMHETTGGAWTRYRVADSTKRGSRLPTLFDKTNQPCYFNHIHCIYEFSVSAKA